MKFDDTKPMGHNKSCSKREVYSNIILPQETRKISNKQPNLTPKATKENFAVYSYNRLPHSDENNELLLKQHGIIIYVM